MCAEVLPKRDDETALQWTKRLQNREIWWIKRLHSFTPKGHNVKDVQHMTAQYRRNQHRHWPRTGNRQPRQTEDEDVPIRHTQGVTGSRAQRWRQIQENISSDEPARRQPDTRTFQEKQKANQSARRKIQEQLKRPRPASDPWTANITMANRRQRTANQSPTSTPPRPIPRDTPTNYTQSNHTPPTPPTPPIARRRRQRSPEMPPPPPLPIPPTPGPLMPPLPPTLPPQPVQVRAPRQFTYDIWRGIDNEWKQSVPLNDLRADRHIPAVGR